MNRAIFCTYWLYFFGFRGVLGHVRLFDYIGMSLVVLGLMHLLFLRLLNWRLAGWVTILLSPLAIAVILDPSMSVIFFVSKTYVLALYFACYFKSMRLTIIEFVCFAVPIVVSVYFFLYPKTFYELYLLKGRMAGISEPNFTSLSLIISICGAFGIYILTGMKRVKVAAVAIAIIAFFGVILTASRAGFIGATIALCVFLLTHRKITYASVAVVSAIFIIGWGSLWDSFTSLPVFERFKYLIEQHDPLRQIFLERSFTEIALYDVLHGEWFVGGGLNKLVKWGIYFRVPHNSLLDIGLAFGKASFYFYGAFLLVLLGINFWKLSTKWHRWNQNENDLLLTAMLFLSLLPMYMTLSAGLAMDFVLWLVLGAYPLLHGTPNIAYQQLMSGSP